MNYKFGLRGHDIADNFEDMCRVAFEKGIEKLQFAMAKTMTDINFDEIGYDKQLSHMVKEKLDANNLHVSVLGCYIDPIAADKTILETQLNRFKNFLYYGKDFGANVIGTETGAKKTKEETFSEENYQYFLENMTPLIREAEKIGVIVGIEPVYGGTIFLPERMKGMIDDVKSDNLGVILDVSNMIFAETRDMQCDIINDSFDLFGDRIKAIHLKDFTFEDGKKSFTVAGTGELMTELIFDRMASLPKMPEIILDTTPVDLYDDSITALSNIL